MLFRSQSSGKGLAQDQDISSHPFVVARQHLACPSKTGLDFIIDEQNIFRTATIEGCFQIAAIRQYNTGFTLDRLYQESGDRWIL